MTEPALRLPAQEKARPLRCLLVEDSRFDRSLLRYAAARGGVELDIVEAASLAEAHRRLDIEDFDLLIADRGLVGGRGLNPRSLPGASGRNAGIPTILLSDRDVFGSGPLPRRGGRSTCLARDSLTPQRLAEAIHAAVAPAGRIAEVGAPAPLAPASMASAELARLARMKPLASRMVALVSELRRALPKTEPAAEAALEEIAELSLMLWLDLDGADRASPAAPFA